MMTRVLCRARRKNWKKLRKKSGMLRDSFGNQQAELLLFLMDMEFAMTIGQRL